MVSLFGKKKKGNGEILKAKPCCELCTFSSKVDEEFGHDPELREVISRFVRVPSRVRDIDPEETLKEARKYERSGQTNLALRFYSEAFIAAVTKNSFLWKDYAKDCIRFLRKNEVNPKPYAGIGDYEQMLNMPSVTVTLRGLYIKAIGSIIVEPKK